MTVFLAVLCPSLLFFPGIAVLTSAARAYRLSFMISEVNKSERVRPPDWIVVLQFLAMNFIYLAGVYAWTLHFYPLGRDFAALARPDVLPWGVRTLFAWEMTSFGPWLPGYHLVNLALLYGCMIALFFLTRLATQGPWWLGSLAAVLFMANPLKSEAVLNLSGVEELLPAFLALVALWSYAACARKPAAWRHAAALAMFAAATLPFRSNAGLAAAMLLYEFLIPMEEKAGRWLRVFAVVALGAVAGVAHGVFSPIQSLDPSGMFAPLCLIFYPIGLLPETAARFHESPWLGWATALVTIAIFAQIVRKSQSRAFAFGLLGAAAMRLFQGKAFVDPVHMLGGGSMLVPIALCGVAAGALSQRIQAHPKWARPIVVITTVLCLVFFLLQGSVNWAWRAAGRHVQEFQALAAEASQANDGSEMAILPDYQYYRGAPMMLSDSIACDTLFSRRVPAQSLLKTNFEQPPRCFVTLEKYFPHEAILMFAGQPLVNVFPYPYAFHSAPSTSANMNIDVTEFAHNMVRVRIAPRSGFLPKIRIPFGTQPLGTGVPPVK